MSLYGWIYFFDGLSTLFYVKKCFECIRLNKLLCAQLISVKIHWKSYVFVLLRFLSVC